MFKTLANVFRVPELRNKLLFTIAMLCVYRIGFYVPLPGVDTEALTKQFAQGGALETVSRYLTLFSGGNLGQSTIFGLGIMPYISASIIFQLLATVLPSLEKLQKEGEPGRRKINEWTRQGTVVLCVIQAAFWLSQLTKSDPGAGLPFGLVYLNVWNQHMVGFWIMGIVVLTAGSLFLMWLGEQIDHFGIGNGVSLIIMAGIVSRMPTAIIDIYHKTNLNVSTHKTGQIGIGMLIFLIASFVFVVAGSILLTQAQRRIPIQTAKHMRGRKVYGGNRTYLPLRVNHGGVMPIIFASSLMLFPTMGLQWLATRVDYKYGIGWLAGELHTGSYLHEVLYVGMIFFFSYFWNTVQFQPKEMANQLRDYGSFIPGLRPGPRTAEYLENVMLRITYVGAAFLSVIAVVPTIIATQMQIEWQVTQFLGGTGLLIVISVILDLMNRIEANLVMRDYSGFLDQGGKRKGGGGRRAQGSESQKGNAA